MKTLTISHDDYPLHPRNDCSPFGTLVCFHSRYDLSDKSAASVKTMAQLLAHLLPDVDPGCFRKLLNAVDPDRDYKRFSANELRVSNYVDQCRDTIEMALRDYDTPPREAYDLILSSYLGVILPVYMHDHSGITFSTSPFSCSWDSGQVGVIYMPPSVIDENWKGNLDLARNCLVAEIEELARYHEGRYVYFTYEEDGDTLESCGSILDDDPEAILSYISDSDVTLDHIKEALSSLGTPITIPYTLHPFEPAA